jgi:hypothetical protein
MVERVEEVLLEVDGETAGTCEHGWSVVDRKLERLQALDVVDGRGGAQPRAGLRVGLCRIRQCSFDQCT